MGGSSWPAGSSLTWSTPTRPLPPTVASAALEAGLALGDEGGDPLGGVLGGEQALEGVAFQQQAGFEAAVEAAVDRLLGCPQRQRRALGEAGRRLAGLGVDVAGRVHLVDQPDRVALLRGIRPPGEDRKSTRLNSSHRTISYAVFCLKKKKTKIRIVINVKTNVNKKTI